MLTWVCARSLTRSISLCNWSQPSPVKNKNHLSAAWVCPLKMHGGGSWGPLGKKADTCLSGRASAYQGGQMASREKERERGWREWMRRWVLCFCLGRLTVDETFGIWWLWLSYWPSHTLIIILITYKNIDTSQCELKQGKGRRRQTVLLYLQYDHADKKTSHKPST